MAINIRIHARCGKHPKYFGKGKPTSKCQNCIQIYSLTHPQELMNENGHAIVVKTLSSNCKGEVNSG